MLQCSIIAGRFGRNGSIASIALGGADVCFTLNSDRIADIAGRQLRAIRRHRPGARHAPLARKVHATAGREHGRVIPLPEAHERPTERGADFQAVEKRAKVRAKWERILAVPARSMTWRPT